MPPRSGSPLVIAVAINVLLMAGTAVYLLAAAKGLVPYHKSSFLVLLALAAICNLGFVGLHWKTWSARSLTGKIILMLWGWFVFWFWVFSPPYFLLVMNLNQLQLEWATFAFVWEVLMLGALFLSLCYLNFRPLAKYEAGNRDIPQAEAVRLYRLSVRYPLMVSLLILFLCVIGFGMGEIQVGWFGGLPLIEGIKNYMIGLVAAIFLAVIYYTTLRYFLDPLSSELKEKGRIEKRSRATIAMRMLVASMLLVIGSLFLLQLIVIKSFQTIVRDEVATTLTENILAESWDRSVWDHGTIVQNPDAVALAGLSLSPETIAYIRTHDSGVVDDFDHRIKVVGMLTDQSGAKSAAVIPLDEFYGPLMRTIASFVLGALFVLLGGLGITAASAFTMTRSIRTLTGAIRRLETEPDASIPRIASGDEMEELSETLGFYVRRSQKLDQEKSEFISIASHHLRTPVTEIRWLIESLEKGDIEKNIRTYLPDIKTSVAHLGELVKVLLDTHRLEDATRKMNAERFDLSAFLRAEVERHRPLSEEQQVSLAVNIPEGIEIVADKAFIEIIIESLVSNALVYTPAGGHATVTLRDDGDKAVIECADTGIGIAEKDRELMFIKFKRADNARVVRPNGTGLGLYLAKQAVEQLHGKISYVSEVGKGTTFTVSFPKESGA